MLIDVEVMRRSDGHYIARVLQLPDIVAEAETREAVLAHVRAAMLARRRAGVELVRLEIGESSDDGLWAGPRHAGSFPDDDAYKSMLAAIAQHRQELDQE